MHQRPGEPALSQALTASRSVVDLNRNSVNLRKEIRVGTLNTRSLRMDWQVEEACALATKRSIDILCIQEHRIRVPESPADTPHSKVLEAWVFFFHQNYLPSWRAIR